ncbi:MAG: YqgE/AlgH family protein [Myxococcota bacterium]
MSASLAPGFIIASPPLGDPNFDRTVVLLALHDDDGALGFVVNRPAPLNLGELLAHADYPPPLDDGSPVWLGGPVQPQSGWIIGDDPRLESEGAIRVVGDIRVSSSREAFDQVAADVRDNARRLRQLVCVGYSGWGAQQLEGEIARGAWLPVPFDEGLLFDVPPEERWERAYALLGLNPTQFVSGTIGEA